MAAKKKTAKKAAKKTAARPASKVIGDPSAEEVSNDTPPASPEDAPESEPETPPETPNPAPPAENGSEEPPASEEVPAETPNPKPSSEVQPEPGMPRPPIVDPTKGPIDPVSQLSESEDTPDTPGTPHIENDEPPATTETERMLEESHALNGQMADSMEELIEGMNFMFTKLRKVPGPKGLDARNLTILQARVKHGRELIAKVKG